jgi:hypothetical protein
MGAASWAMACRVDEIKQEKSRSVAVKTERVAQNKGVDGGHVRRHVPARTGPLLNPSFAGSIDVVRRPHAKNLTGQKVHLGSLW